MVSAIRESFHMNNRTNIPKYTVVGAVFLVITLAIVVVTAPTHNQVFVSEFISIVSGTVPALIAAGFAERAGRDIRNGVMTEKVKEGTKQAIKETGIQDVVDATGNGQATTLAMQALKQLLENNTSIHVTHEQPQAGPPRSPNSGD